jgi:Asp-tRNA(Asn)/Glu-tRNA(Gln) amidotransferase A subunit family amidase
MVGQDAADPDSRPYAAPAFRASATEAPPLPPRYAFVRTPMWDKADAEARSALEDLAKEAGAQEVDLPADYAAAWDALRVIMATDMAHNLGAFVDKGEVSKPFRDLVAEGRKVTAVEYLAAMRDARRYAEGMMGIFEQLADAILTLSARGVAPPGLEKTGDPVFNTLWTLTGFPALNLPLLADSQGLPIGVQLVGAPGRDERLLRTAQALVSAVAG